MHQFTIPMLPTSMNQIYVVIPYWSQKRIEMRLRDDVLLWKNSAKDYIPPWDEDVPEEGNGTVWMSFSIYNQWLTKEGKFRKLDLQNLLKVMIDVIADKLGFNDSMVYELRSVKKVQSETEKRVEVEMGYI